jgi:Ca2+-transporting ATPase
MVAGYGAVIAIAILGALYVGLYPLEMPAGEAVTLSFLTLSFARLLHVFNLRDGESPFFRNEVTTNPFVWGAVALCAVFLLAAVYLPILSDLLHTHRPSTMEWAVILAMSMIPVLVIQTRMLIRKHLIRR